MLPQSPLVTRTSPDFPFAHQSMKERIPGIVDNILEYNEDFSPRIKENLRLLGRALRENAALAPPRAPAPDHGLWSSLYASFEKDTWLNTEWLFAETLVYRLVLDATHYWATLRDPFLPVKEEEMQRALDSGLLDTVINKETSLDRRIETALTGALWGNRFDLSLVEALEHGRAQSANILVLDHLAAATRLLIQKSVRTVHLVMDNAGTEQLMDYALAHTLLTSELASQVVLHVKMHPILVSDVTVPDVHRLLQLLTESNGLNQSLGNNLIKALESGRLDIIPHFFWNSPLSLRDMPDDIRKCIHPEDFVILKGDFNYRKASLDAIWPSKKTLFDALGPIPCPFLALRTLKCNALVGVGLDKMTDLNHQYGMEWRTSGQFGMVQLANPLR